TEFFKNLNLAKYLRIFSGFWRFSGVAQKKYHGFLADFGTFFKQFFDDLFLSGHTIIVVAAAASATTRPTLSERTVRRPRVDPFGFHVARQLSRHFIQDLLGQFSFGLGDLLLG